MSFRKELPQGKSVQGLPVPVGICAFAAFIAACFERNLLVLGFGCLAVLLLERTRVKGGGWLSVDSSIGVFRAKRGHRLLAREPEKFDWRLASKVTIPGDRQKRKIGALVKADLSGPSEAMIWPIASAMEHFKSAGLAVFDPVLDEIFYDCCLWFGVSERDEKRPRRGETIVLEELNGLGPKTILNAFDKFSPLELGAPDSWEVYDMPTCDCHLTIHKNDCLISIHVGFLNGKAVGACMEYC